MYAFCHSTIYLKSSSTMSIFTFRNVYPRLESEWFRPFGISRRGSLPKLFLMVNLNLNQIWMIENRNQQLDVSCVHSCRLLWKPFYKHLNAEGARWTNSLLEQESAYLSLAQEAVSRALCTTHLHCDIFHYAVRQLHASSFRYWMYSTE